MMHFAYGSNMSRALMHQRCAGAKAMGPARLEGWRYVISRDGYASLVACPGSAVHGVLWRLTLRDLAALNVYESLASGLYRRRMLPVRYGAKRVSALTYLGRHGQPRRPQPGYQDGVVVAAARDWGLPADYLAELARWSASAWRGARRAEPGR